MNRAAGPAPLPADEIQSLVLCDPAGTHVLHLVLTFKDGGAGRHFLQRALLHEATRACAVTAAGAEGTPAAAGVQASIGFTYRGLKALHTPPQVMRPFLALSPAFAAGAPLRAAERLGDTGPSAPNHWEPAFALDTAHAVLSLHSDDPAALGRVLASLRRLALPPAFADRADRIARTPMKTKARRTLIAAAAAAAGEDSVCFHEFWGHRFGTRKQQHVHFGLRDGLSKVGIQGWPPGERGAARPLHAPGEFLLGHANDHRYNPWVLSTSAKDTRAFFRNGSFGVLRKMRQDVPAFEEWLQAQADRLRALAQAGGLPAGAPVDPDWKTYIKAKMVGRWPDGRRFENGQWDRPGASDPGADFDYAADKDGLGCPFGSHARRMNPRTGLDAGRRPAQPGDAAHIRQRPLLRRGRSYGPPHGEGGEHQERGLLGLFFCASIEDQFEHLLGQWAERPVLGVDDRGDAKDPVMGQHDNPASRFDIPLPCGGSLSLADFRPFVRTRGTLYAFHPSLPALKLLLDNDDFMDKLDEDLSP